MDQLKNNRYFSHAKDWMAYLLPRYAPEPSGSRFYSLYKLFQFQLRFE